ncbi:SGNH/GDSL hydrolase family protein [Mobilitalea sibirica]|uniref:SGNH/GDSL hydrolase family protein n=1 Tax=Mobilitalea sibirica TaxID=1462919 RepID=A0A8J7H0V4_9FIRM|nr:SGNH/GDSL hydrolase family protein [Mobilitalea sibirica]MBH1939812.1 SGNH/GDSL hydrolase family protein [Mobilitalea sibirica]
MIRKILINISVITLAIIILALLQELFMPKYMSSIHEGNLVEEYYDEVKEHDVIFIGDCEVFSNVSPITLWENYGITSYIRGSAQQLIWQSYYLLEETLNYEKPKAVVFNVLSMKYNEPQKEAYNRLTLDGMKLSKSKISAVKASMMEDEQLITYLFPILRYHSRWNELSGEDFKYLFDKDKLSHNGYLMRIDVKPVNVIPKGRKLADYSFGDNSYDYLDKMTKLCKENDIELILIKSPSVYPYWYEEWDEQMVNYAKENNLTYINFLDEAEEIGIDYSKDTYDGGLHLNLSGAEKFTDYFGSILSNEFHLPDHREDARLKEIWDKKITFYYSMEEHQRSELEKYGYLKSYGAQAQEKEDER